MPNILEELTVAARNLPELYQPIFEHEIHGIKPTRNCFDRLPDIKKIFDDLTAKLNRPPRVLDLGCAQGFFSLYAAKWGGAVTGIDIGIRNVNFCQILAREHPNYNVRFIQARAEEFLKTVKVDEYDLLLCFNVLHWITLPHGFSFVQNLLKDLAEKIPNGIFELALKSEFPQNNLPDNYRDFFKGYSFVRVLSCPVRHEAEQSTRPLCFVSKKYVHFEELGLLKIDKIFYDRFNPKAVTYYVCGNKFVKCHFVMSQAHFDKIQREITFLKAMGGKNDLPQLYTSKIENDEVGVRVFLARDKIEGKTIWEKIENGEDFDRWDIIKQALQWMIFLEKHGYYQSDLHLSNFILSDSGKLYLIDFEYAMHEPISIQWPYNIRLMFFNFMNSLFEKSSLEFNTGNDKRFSGHTNGKLLTEFHKHVSEYQYRQILALKDSEGFFERLYEILFINTKEIETPTIPELEILAIEKYLDELGMNVQAHGKNLNALIEIVKSQQKRIEQLEKIINEKLK